MEHSNDQTAVDRRNRFDRFLEIIEPTMETTRKIGFEIGILEKRLHLLKTQEEQLVADIRERLKEAALGELEKAEVNELTSAGHKKFIEAHQQDLQKAFADLDSLRKEITAPLTMSVQFDEPAPLKITVFQPDQSPIVIDLVKSIENDIRNLHNPIISRCIYRYWASARGFKGHEKFLKELGVNTKARSRPRQAVENLSQVSKALLAVKKEDFTPTREHDPFEWSRMRTFDKEYFGVVLEIITSSKFKNQKTPTNKKTTFRRILKGKLPDGNHTDTISWLESRIVGDLMPKRKTAETLHNDFWSWKWEMKRSSVRPALSKVRKEANKPFDNDGFTKALEDGLDENLSLLIPFQEFPIYTPLSRLRLVTK